MAQERALPPEVSHATADLPVASPAEKRARAEVITLLQHTPIPSADLWRNLPLYLRSATVFDILAMHTLYQRILDVPGVVIEFGIRWGQRLATFIALREILEPGNPYRYVIGFDTFAGFPEISPEDGSAPAVQPGAFAVTPGYEHHLTEVLSAHERAGSLGHLRRFALQVGDVRQTLPAYLATHPETVIALAYFDLDLYEPTKACLTAIRPHLVRGSLVAFDEMAHPAWPGETTALKAVLNIADLRLEKPQGQPYPAFFVV
jgi:macrocin-O-methyltransferase TylF-like protien